MHRAEPEACAVLLHCGPDMQAHAACLFAGWLHWYCHMQMQVGLLVQRMFLRWYCHANAGGAASTAHLVASTSHALRFSFGFAWLLMTACL